MEATMKLGLVLASLLVSTAAYAQAPGDYGELHAASGAFLDAVRDLVKVIDREEVYSAAARVYVESFKHEIWWVRDIVLKVAA